MVGEFVFTVAVTAQQPFAQVVPHLDLDGHGPGGGIRHERFQPCRKRRPGVLSGATVVVEDFGRGDNLPCHHRHDENFKKYRNVDHGTEIDDFETKDINLSDDEERQ